MADFWSEPTHTGGKEGIAMSSGAEIQEIDLDELEADLYKIIEAIDRQNYGKAKTLAWIQWGAVHKFRISFDDSHLPATTGHDWRALVTKAWYWLLNRRPLRCRLLGYNCEWVYPYGWVPEGCCPDHD